MKKYSYEEIIQQALALANLENSAFVSDYENINMVNAAWQDLYQKSINAGETRWLKTVPVVAKCMPLPGDFYQLYALQDIDKKEQILRANKYNFYSRSYRIINDRLVLENTGLHTILPAGYAKVIGEEGSLEVTESDVQTDNPIWCTKEVVYNPTITINGITVSKTTTTITTLNVDGTTTTHSSVTTGEAGSGTVTKKIFRYIPINDVDYYYYYLDGTNESFDFTPYITAAEKNIQMSYFPAPKKILPQASFTDPENEVYELDYPNNLFYTALIYKLAIYYLVKQKEDPSVVTALYQDALETYYDTILSDVNQPVRINNAYANNGEQ